MHGVALLGCTVSDRQALVTVTFDRPCRLIYPPFHVQLVCHPPLPILTNPHRPFPERQPILLSRPPPRPPFFLPPSFSSARGRLQLCIHAHCPQSSATGHAPCHCSNHPTPIYKHPIRHPTPTRAPRIHFPSFHPSSRNYAHYSRSWEQYYALHASPPPVLLRYTRRSPELRLVSLTE